MPLSLRSAHILMGLLAMLAGQASANPSVGAGVSESVSADKSKSLDVRDSATAQKSSGTRTSDSKARAMSDAESDSVQNNRSVSVSLDTAAIALPLILRLETGDPVGKQGVTSKLSQSCEISRYNPQKLGPAVFSNDFNPRDIAARESEQMAYASKYVPCAVIHGLLIVEAIDRTGKLNPTEENARSKMEQSLADSLLDPAVTKELEAVWFGTECRVFKNLNQGWAVTEVVCDTPAGMAVLNIQSGAVTLNQLPIWGGATFMGQTLTVAKQGTAAVAVTRTDTKTRSKSTDHYTDGSVAVSKSKSKSASASVKTSKSRDSKAGVNAAPTQ